MANAVAAPATHILEWLALSLTFGQGVVILSGMAGGRRHCQSSRGIAANSPILHGNIRCAAELFHP